MASPISSRVFGRLADGRTVEAFTLSGRGGLVLEAITFGGIVTRLLVPASDGALADVVLGFNNLASYLSGHPYLGAIIGRVAGRTANAAFTLDGRTCRLAPNEPPHHLHGGELGFDKRLWRAAPAQRRDGSPSLRLSYSSPDGEEAYPGNVEVAVTYTVTDDNTFLIETEASSDRVTPLSLTHHSYFNLAGEGAGTIEDHWLTIYADQYVPVDDHFIATGRLESIAGRSNDFRRARRLGESFLQVYPPHGDLYALRPHGEDEMTLAASLEEHTSGRVLTVSTTERYLQFYTGCDLIVTRSGKSGKNYPPFGGLCLECEGYPDSSNPDLRNDTLLYPGQTQRRSTAYAFSVKAPSDASPETHKRI